MTERSHLAHPPPLPPIPPSLHTHDSYNMPKGLNESNSSFPLNTALCMPPHCHGITAGLPTLALSQTNKSSNLPATPKRGNKITRWHTRRELTKMTFNHGGLHHTHNTPPHLRIHRRMTKYIQNHTQRGETWSNITNIRPILSG
ncbi:Hypothetical predicted protein [Pelobates cultripes]|uniref:Uncharacterized protein n=1 Tax=Pelobates cultripes TaxID=61616 RepID=A0AAD1S6G8_PELCU|nr:Hypothetical predicted protein [Pelobates cultripes]